MKNNNNRRIMIIGSLTVNNVSFKVRKYCRSEHKRKEFLLINITVLTFKMKKQKIV